MLVSCTRPRSKFQVIRYVDGPKLMLTCTRRGAVSLYELYVTRLRNGTWVEKFRKLTGLDASEALNRAVAAGYDPIAIADRLKLEAVTPDDAEDDAPDSERTMRADHDLEQAKDRRVLGES